MRLCADCPLSLPMHAALSLSPFRPLKLTSQLELAGEPPEGLRTPAKFTLGRGPKTSKELQVVLLLLHHPALDAKPLADSTAALCNSMQHPRTDGRGWPLPPAQLNSRDVCSVCIGSVFPAAVMCPCTSVWVERTEGRTLGVNTRGGEGKGAGEARRRGVPGGLSQPLGESRGEQC